MPINNSKVPKILHIQLSILQGWAHHCNIKLHLFLMPRPTCKIHKCWKEEELFKPFVSLQKQANFHVRSGRRRNMAQGYLRLLSGCETWCYHGNKCTGIQARATKSVLHVNPDGENQSHVHKSWGGSEVDDPFPPDILFFSEIERSFFALANPAVKHFGAVIAGKHMNTHSRVIPSNHLFRRKGTE